MTTHPYARTHPFALALLRIHTQTKIEQRGGGLPKERLRMRMEGEKPRGEERVMMGVEGQREREREGGEEGSEPKMYSQNKERQRDRKGEIDESHRESPPLSVREKGEIEREGERGIERDKRGRRGEIR